MWPLVSFKLVQTVALTQRVSACCLFRPFSVIPFIQNPKFTEISGNILVLNVSKLAKDWQLTTLPLPRDPVNKEPMKEGREFTSLFQNSWCQILEPVLMNSLSDAWRSRLKPNISASCDLR